MLSGQIAVVTGASSVPHSRCYSADLSRDAELERLSVKLHRDFDDTHILVHAAGMFSAAAVKSFLSRARSTPG